MFKLLGRRKISTLLIVEHSAGKPLATNANALTAAQKLGFPITALVSGTESQVAQVSKVVAQYPGVKTVLQAKGPQYDHKLAEPHAELIASVGTGFSHIVCAHSVYGKNVLPRASALMDISPIADVIEIDSADTFKRPIYAGNAIATVKSTDKIKMLTIRSTSFASSDLSGGSATVQDVEGKGTGILTFNLVLSQFVSQELSKSDRPELGAAKIIVSGGRGLKSAENFEKLMFGLADKLGAAGFMILT